MALLCISIGAFSSPVKEAEIGLACELRNAFNRCNYRNLIFCYYSSTVIEVGEKYLNSRPGAQSHKLSSNRGLPPLSTSITEDYDVHSFVKSDDRCGSNHVKFLYSYGGQILPRPSDGKLCYIGRDTRVVAGKRNISFTDFIARMSKVFGFPVRLKYQLPMEDLDALVSLKSDEDLENMLEEYDRVGSR